MYTPREVTSARISDDPSTGRASVVPPDSALSPSGPGGDNSNNADELGDDGEQKPVVTTDKIEIYCRFRPTRNPARALCDTDKTTGKVRLNISKC